MPACGDIWTTENGQFLTTEEGELLLFSEKVTQEPVGIFVQETPAISYDAWCSDE